MPPELVVALGAFVTVLLLARFVMGPSRSGRRFEPEAEARRFVDRRITEHLEQLAQSYCERSRPDSGRSGAFADDIETFIASVVLRDAPAAVDDEDVLAALRELVVLERAYVYDQILTRVVGHLPQADDRG